MKRNLALLLGLALLLSLTTNVALGTERTKVQVMSWWDITNSKPLQELESGFEAANPDLDLEFPMVSGGQYYDKITTVIAGGGSSVPDVIMLGMPQVAKFANASAIQPLDELMSQEYKDSLYPSVLEALKLNGKVYAAARDVSPMAMYLNVDLFKAADVEIPSADWTIEEFLEIGKQLTEVSDDIMASRWGYYFPKYSDTMYDWIVAYGGRYVTQDGTTSLLNSQETKTGFQFMYDLIHTHKICPTEAQHSQFGDGNFASFLAGKVGMQIAALSLTSSINGLNPPFEYLILPLPLMNGKPFTHTFVNTWAIPRGARDPGLSWRVIEFLSGTGGQQIALDNGMGLPASKEVDTTAFIAKRADFQVFVDQLSYAVPYETYVYGAEISAMINEMFEPLWLGQASADEVCEAAHEEAISILTGDK